MTPPDSVEDLPFRHYPLKNRLIAWISAHCFDSVTYTVRHGLNQGMKRKGGLGWIPARFSAPVQTAEYRFWEQLDLGGLTVYDIGAFHGILTLFFASRAGRVICFEPNSKNYQRLMENVRLNGLENVLARQVGVGSRREKLRMTGSPLMPGGSTLDRHAAESLARAGLATVVEDIALVPLDEEVQEAGLPAPDFIKIDIEGWELEALRGARNVLAQHRPALFMEMHGETMREKKRKVSEIVAFLWENGYRRILHVESGAGITPENCTVAAQGHLYCPKQ